MGASVVMVWIGVLYLANVICVAVAPEARVMGWSDYRKEGLKGPTTFQRAGVSRLFLEPSGQEYTLMLKIGGSQAPWIKPTAGTTALYVGYMTLFVGVLLKGLNHLRRLFQYFGRGEIFTKATVGELQRIGHVVLWWALVSFLGAVTVIVAAGLSGLPSQANIELPITPLAIGLIISLITAVFAEGKRLEEEARLTV